MIYVWKYEGSHSNSQKSMDEQTGAFTTKESASFLP